eukprot:5414795-Prorocentrum_lima.AAC.1
MTSSLVGSEMCIRDSIHIEWQGNTLIRHCSHFRRALIYWTYVAADVLTSHAGDALTLSLIHI